MRAKHISFWNSTQIKSSVYGLNVKLSSSTIGWIVPRVSTTTEGFWSASLITGFHRQTSTPLSPETIVIFSGVIVTISLWILFCTSSSSYPLRCIWEFSRLTKQKIRFTLTRGFIARIYRVWISIWTYYGCFFTFAFYTKTLWAETISLGHESEHIPSPMQQNPLRMVRSLNILEILGIHRDHTNCSSFSLPLSSCYKAVNYHHPSILLSLALIIK